MHWGCVREYRGDCLHMALDVHLFRGDNGDEMHYTYPCPSSRLFVYLVCTFDGHHSRTDPLHTQPTAFSTLEHILSYLVPTSSCQVGLSQPEVRPRRHHTIRRFGGNQALEMTLQ